jgi:hypothetical protein
LAAITVTDFDEDMYAMFWNLHNLLVYIFIYFYM